jgi:nitrate reductase gamma subunit
MAMIGGALLVSIIRIFRRFISSVLRLISSPDDYFALFTLTVWFALGVPAVASMVGIVEGEIFLVAYLFATSFFLVYVPFSKISHYLYYPFTRYYIGKTLGHRGSMPAARAQV